ncbi:hypothetical protein [Deinococcus sp. SL84]|uniref:hypothetical protein n=1 Tax=Deinococcus sp. SL84 TaxID=2994663 RepID=UPI0022723D6C|nr:hypothetical protein [Deinococcus sp. SL84]MCY1703990.1 hypothetical protein [Deinococcus sp. SL84]
MSSIRQIGRPMGQVKKAGKACESGLVQTRMKKTQSHTRTYISSKPGITPAMREVAEKAAAQFIRELRAGKI